MTEDPLELLRVLRAAYRPAPVPRCPSCGAARERVTTNDEQPPIWYCSAARVLPERRDHFSLNRREEHLAASRYVQLPSGDQRVLRALDLLESLLP